MKRISGFLIFAALCVSCSVAAGAQTHMNSSQIRASQKADRKQQKAMKKYAKAQRKAQQKMIKKDRKNTHLPGRKF
jgi:hypothetical protein